MLLHDKVWPCGHYNSCQCDIEMKDNVVFYACQVCGAMYHQNGLKKWIKENYPKEVEYETT